MTIPPFVISKDVKRLINQLWKLIPMRENNEDWKTQLHTVWIEITGLGEILNIVDENYLILLSKIKGLQQIDIDFEIYRKTVFECISLLGEIINE